MKKTFFPFLLALLLLGGLTVATPTAHATACYTDTDCVTGKEICDQSNSVCVPDIASSEYDSGSAPAPAGTPTKDDPYPDQYYDKTGTPYSPSDPGVNTSIVKSPTNPANSNPTLSTNTGTNTLETLFQFILTIINRYLVPLIFAFAFLFFLFGAFQTFIRGAKSKDVQTQGRQFMMYSLIGFFVMFALWGIVNLVIATIPFGSTNQPAIPTFSNTSSS